MKTAGSLKLLVKGVYHCNLNFSTTSPASQNVHRVAFHCNRVIRHCLAGAMLRRHCNLHIAGECVWFACNAVMRNLNLAGSRIIVVHRKLRCNEFGVCDMVLPCTHAGQDIAGTMSGLCLYTPLQQRDTAFEVCYR